MRHSKDFMSERVKELENERDTALAEKEIVNRFIEESKDIPSIVLVTLKQKIRKLDITVEDCNLRLKNYD
ncbi:hypothetical protein MHI57_24355 [Cytobacillus sp. FSL K6-0129]|uniref:hypothetical protein n=1 Tax=unclassified Cytobacillus TaxID=2675268 RepID=UPI0030FA6C21